MKPLSRKINQANHYTYEDWYEGRIALGGIKYDDPDNKIVPFVNWNNVEKSSILKIKSHQKLLFKSDVDSRYLKMKSGVDELFANSEDKNRFVDETLNDFHQLFETECKIDLHLRFLNIYFTSHEVNKIQSFYIDQVIRGNRNYDFVQSPKQTSSLFRNPPIEVEAEVFSKCFYYVKKELHRTDFPLKLKEIALAYIYQGKNITRINAEQIAEQFGYSSGEKLYQNFSSFSKKARRVDPTNSKRGNESKVELLERVKTFLKYKGFSIQQVEEELKKLKDNILMDN